MGGLQREARGPRHESPLWQQLGARPSCRGRRRGQAPARGVEHSALSSHSQNPTSPGSAWRPPEAGSHRVGCGGSVAGPERRQGDGRGRAGSHSASGSPRADPRGSLKLAYGGVPSSAWEPRAGGDKRGSGWGEESHPDPRPRPGGQRTPSSREKMEGRHPAREKPAECRKQGGSGRGSPARSRQLQS